MKNIIRWYNLDELYYFLNKLKEMRKFKEVAQVLDILNKIKIIEKKTRLIFQKSNVVQFKFYNPVDKKEIVYNKEQVNYIVNQILLKA